MGAGRRRFSEEFKREVVLLACESGRRSADVAPELDVRPDMIRRWCKQFAEGGTKPSAQELEVTRLRRELRVVREERDILIGQRETGGSATKGS